MQVVKKTNICRVCKNTQLRKVLSFGPTPLANAFIPENKIDSPELYYPLDVYFCINCNFVQLGHTVHPDILFKDYVYASSTSPVFMHHFEKFAQSFAADFLKKKGSLIIDIGSNDGILLAPFKKRGFSVLGIEPAGTVATLAKKKGIETIEKYFSVALAKSIAKKRGKAALITATNVFAHIDDVDEVIEGVKELLDKEGVFVIEAPYLVDLLKNKYFDLVYHEHLSYWSTNSLGTLFKRHDMKIFKVEKVPVHGGSIRVYVKKREEIHPITESVNKFQALEKKEKIFSVSTFEKYAQSIQRNKITLLTLLARIKSQGKSIAGYGAPAKGNTLLNFFSIGNDTLDFIIDDSPFKQGLFTPGKHIPVVPNEILYKKLPDYLLVLAWNFANPIMEMHKKYKTKGGKFIIPVPTPKIIE